MRSNLYIFIAGEISDTDLFLHHSKLQSEFTNDSVQPAQSPYRLNLRYANEAAGTLAEKELCFRRAEMSLLHIRQQTLNIFRFLRPEMTWTDVSHLSTKLCLLQGRLDNWHKALPPNLHFPLPAEPDGTCVHSTEEARPRFLGYHYAEANELILRPWLYICLHMNNRPAGDIQSASDIEQAIQAHFAIKAREMASQHQKAVLLRIRFESMAQLLRSMESVSVTGGPWFRANNCVVLALLLVASHIEGSDIPDIGLAMENHWLEVVKGILSTLALDDSSELNVQYVDLLHYILAQQNRIRLS